MKKLFPLILIIIGVGSGVGAGLALKPEAEDHVGMEASNPCGEIKDKHAKMEDHSEEEIDEATLEYVKMNNQFVVPVVSDDKVEALVVLSLSVEVNLGQKETVYSREPKLRDAFLQVLFDHANMGGFRGAFTNANNMDVLRRALQEAAEKSMQGVIRDVLIVDIARQDV